MTIIHDGVWAITQGGMQKVLAAQEMRTKLDAGQLSVRLASDNKVAADSGEEFDSYYMVNRIGPLAIVSISGSLTNDDSPYNRYYGELSYAEIRRAIMEAVEHEEVKAILLDMDTPGGTVSGITENREFLKDVDKNFKPIYTHASSSMCSGGYWLGSVGRRITTSELASVGSIGVIMVHAEYSKAYDKAGITINVLRQGEFKALMTPYEELSDKARKESMDSMGVVYDTFLSLVSDSRGIPVESLKANAAEGRVFYGKEAVRMGLADEVSSFDEVARKLVRYYTDNHTAPVLTSNNAEIGVDMKRVLTAAGEAAIAAGVPKEQVLAQKGMTTVSEESEQHEKTEAELAVEAQAEADAKAKAEAGEGKTEAELAVEAQAEADAKAKATKGEDSSAVTDRLLTKVTDLTVELADVKASLKAKEADLASMSASHTRLTKIAAQATGKMQVALGGTAMDLSSMDAEVIVNTHDKVLSQFNQKFHIGSSAEVPSSGDMGSDAAAATGTDTMGSAGQRMTKF